MRSNSRGNALGASGSLVIGSSKLGHHSVRVLSPDQLKTKTQRAALQVMQREERNAKKSRLETLLLQQFCGKYGVKDRGQESVINSTIQRVISDFLESFVNISDAERYLPQLEKEVKLATDTIKNSQLQAKRDRETERISRENSQRNRKTDGDDKNALVREGVKELQRVEWPLVTAVVSSLTEEESQREKQRLAALKREQFKSNLDEQLQFKDKVKSETLREKETAKQKIDRERDNLQLEAIEAHHRKEQRFRDEREMRMKQIEENKAQREKEREMKIMQEKYEMAKAKRMAEEEEQEKLERRERQKQQQERLFLENEENKRLKEQQKLEKFAYEKKLNEEYERKLEAENLARSTAFQDRVQKQHAFFSHFENGVTKDLNKEKERENANLTRAMQEKQRLDEEKEREKVEKRKANAHSAQDYNIQMMNEKKRQQERAKMEGLEMRLKLEKDARDAEREKREAIERKRIHLLEEKKELDKQMIIRREALKRDKGTFIEGEDEKHQEMLKKLEADPAMLSKVLEKVHFYRATPEQTKGKKGQSGNNIF